MKRQQSYVLIAPPSSFGGPVLFVSLDGHHLNAARDDEPALDLPAVREKMPAMNWVRKAITRARGLPTAVRTPRQWWRSRARRVGI